MSVNLTPTHITVEAFEKTKHTPATAVNSPSMRKSSDSEPDDSEWAKVEINTIDSLKLSAIAQRYVGADSIKNPSVMSLSILIEKLAAKILEEENLKDTAEKERASAIQHRTAAEKECDAAKAAAAEANKQKDEAQKTIEKEKSAAAKALQEAASATKALQESEAKKMEFLKERNAARKELNLMHTQRLNLINAALDGPRSLFLKTLGTVLPQRIKPAMKSAPEFDVVQRPNGIVALVTKGLWQPANSSASFGAELIAEAPKDEKTDLLNFWLYHCLLEGAISIMKNPAALQKELAERKYATVEINNVKLPKEFVDPQTGAAHLLLGVVSPEIPQSFGALEHNVPVVTARLLTHAEWQNHAKIKEQFQKDGSYHRSSLSVGQSNVYSTKTILDRIADYRKICAEQAAFNSQFAKEHDAKLASATNPMAAAGQNLPKFTPSVQLMPLPALNSRANSPLDLNQAIAKWPIKTAISQAMEELTTLIRKNLKNSALDQFQRKPGELIQNLLLAHSEFAGYLPATLSMHGADSFEHQSNIMFELKVSALLKRLVQRVEWMLEVQGKEKIPTSTILEFIGTDIEWIKDVETMIKEFAAHRDKILQHPNYKKHEESFLKETGGQKWPHDNALRTEMERVGFAFKPRMIHKDCSVHPSGIKVFGWHVWDNPASFLEG